MDTYTFTLLLDGPDVLAEATLDAFAEAGCDDALFGERGNVAFADFDREAESLQSAVTSAITAVEAAAPGVRVLRVEPDEFVSLTAIAGRTGRSRESIRLLAHGDRGPGGFPSPERWVDARTTLWRWSEVAEWFEHRLGETVTRPEDAHFVAALNGLLELRRHTAQLPDERSRLAVAAFARQAGGFTSAANA